MLPSVDAVDEMRVQTNSCSASYGRRVAESRPWSPSRGPTVFTATLSSSCATNALNANSFFSNRAGAKIAPLHIDQYGGSVGGTVIKNRTFFFGAFERDVNKSGGYSLFNVPTPTERAGDFSHDINQAGALKTIYNPFSATWDPNNAGQFLRTPFPGNIIPASLMDPVGVKAASYWPRRTCLAPSYPARPAMRRWAIWAPLPSPPTHWSRLPPRWITI